MKISLANVNDIKDIMSFINSEWKEGHILARDELFFKYEHQQGDNINFVLAKDDDYKIVGILGFIPFAIKPVSDVSTVIWKVVKNNKNPVLGIQLLQFLQKNHRIGIVCSVGINEKTIAIYKYLGMYTGTLKHYAIINYSIKEFAIAKFNGVIETTALNKPIFPEYEVRLMKDKNEIFTFNNTKKSFPYKNSEYLNKRYFEHPIYKYEVFGVYNGGEIEGIFVTRVEFFMKAKALRIVDFLGNEETIGTFAIFLTNHMKLENFEYADFYCFGLNEPNILNSGFQLIKPNSEEIIIPNYFNPFVQKNIPLHFFSDTEDARFLKLFKADGDQDRPS